MLAKVYSYEINVLKIIKNNFKKFGPWWCLPSTLTIRVRIPLKPTVFSVKFVLEKNENKQKVAGVGPFKK